MAIQTFLLLHHTVVDSTQHIQTTTVDPVWADSLRSLPEYQYGQSEQSILSVILDWFWSIVREVLDGRGDSVVDYIGWAVIIAVLVLAVRLIVRGGFGSPLAIGSKGSVSALEDELVAPEDYDRLIGEAASLRHFRIAVRLLYRRSLARLRDDKMIEWRPEKTDSDYVREVRGRWEHAELFAAAVREFQRVWFGEQDLDEVQYERIRAVFDSLPVKGATQ